MFAKLPVREDRVEFKLTVQKRFRLDIEANTYYLDELEASNLYKILKVHFEPSELGKMYQVSPYQPSPFPGAFKPTL